VLATGDIVLCVEDGKGVSKSRDKNLMKTGYQGRVNSAW